VEHSFVFVYTNDFNPKDSFTSNIRINYLSSYLFENKNIARYSENLFMFTLLIVYQSIIEPNNHCSDVCIHMCNRKWQKYIDTEYTVRFSRLIEWVVFRWELCSNSKENLKYWKRSPHTNERLHQKCFHVSKNEFHQTSCRLIQVIIDCCAYDNKWLD
jgi:hypothetical protein